MNIASSLILIASIISLSFATHTRQDDSIKYVSVVQTHGSRNADMCARGLAAMVNTSNQDGGPNRNIRVYYTANGHAATCDTRPKPKPEEYARENTFIGCWGAEFVIVRAEYIP